MLARHMDGLRPSRLQICKVLNLLPQKQASNKFKEKTSKKKQMENKTHYINANVQPSLSYHVCMLLRRWTWGESNGGGGPFNRGNIT